MNIITLIPKATLLFKKLILWSPIGVNKSALLLMHILNSAYYHLKVDISERDMFVNAIVLSQ